MTRVDLGSLAAFQEVLRYFIGCGLQIFYEKRGKKLYCSFISSCSVCSLRVYFDSYDIILYEFNGRYDLKLYFSKKLVGRFVGFLRE